ncbi:DUF4174 domain-containing protein [Pontibacter amylolyticus]|uniref:DUF4174 domain-containing protein n=1 Tax=Pontibacter amylolyticus TaxID=1424080 RepID=A0ABQ1VZT6_9BACT|nr:DUF4174 domain-containing protein [Pontibacter amylolyticus]GGG07837.1 hypothetical protein GCM10011323_10520 [Pontibacter amylolyticus]
MNLNHFFRTAFCLALLLPHLLLAQTKTPMKLDDLQWEKRVLLLFAPAPDNADFVEQQNRVRKNTQGIAERQLEVLELVPGGKEAGMREELLQKFAVAPGVYTLVLLGKDGLEKYRSPKAVPLEEVFKIIDQMPMRRQEMRKQD